jgi:hypothetical protein
MAFSYLSRKSYVLRQIKIITLSLLAASISCFGQLKHSIKLGTQIPFQFCGSYDLQFNKRWSTNIGMGLILPPYNKAIVEIAKAVGLDNDIGNLVGEAFSFGFNLDIHGRYHFKNGIYTGLYLQSVNLYANTSNIYGVTLDVQVESNLYQFGASIGKNWDLKKKRFQIGTEFSISQNISSKSKMRSPLSDLRYLDEGFTEYLKPYFNKYAFIPTINVYWIIKMGKQERE